MKTVSKAEQNKSTNCSNTIARFSTRELTHIAILVVLVAVMSQISMPIPISPVPISFGLVGVYMCGILLRPKSALLALFTYLLLGTVGMPVFSNFRGGIGTLFGATGGYLLSYPLIAWLISFCLNKRLATKNDNRKIKTLPFIKTAFVLVIAQAILYFCGTVWLSFFTDNDFFSLLTLAVLPYIPLDIIKIIFCTSAMLPIKNHLTKYRLL